MGKTTNQSKSNSKSNSNAKKPNSKAKEVVGKVLEVGEVVGKVANTAGAIMKLLNHTTWYEHYDTSNLVALNLSSKQNVKYNNATKSVNFPYSGTNDTTYRFNMPSIYALEMALVKPISDQNGWDSGIRLLWQQLRTANSGRVNYDQSDLEKYVLTVRTLHALQAILRRAYKLTYTYTSVNNAVPTFMLSASGLFADDMISNSANLFQYVQRFTQRLKVSAPLHIDLFDRTQWLFGNIFTDSTSHKPSYIVPDCLMGAATSGDNSRVDALPYFFKVAEESIWTVGNIQLVSGSGNAPGSVPFTFKQLTTACDTALDRFLGTNIYATIAADIIKAYGDSAFYPFELPKIDDAIEFVYDETILNQIQNATIVHSQAFSREVELQHDVNGDHFAPYNTNINCTLDSNQRVVQNARLSFIKGADSKLTPSISYASGAVNYFFDVTNAPLVNWHSDSITSGQVLSITRLSCPLANDEPTSTHYRLKVASCGTEIVLDCIAYVQGSYGTDTSTDKLYLQSIAGIVDTYTYGNNSQQVFGLRRNATFFWANLDYAPRMIPVIVSSTPVAENKITFAIDTIGPVVLDWDIFSSTNSELLTNYFSYGNQSLLYAGPSQNQADTNVYAATTAKYTGSKDTTPRKYSDRRK